MGERARCDLETVNLDDLRHNLDSNHQRFGEIGGSGDNLGNERRT